MLFKEFGDKKNPVVILLHGGGLSWWSLKKQIDELQKDYFVVAPIIDGHGDDFNNTFISIEDSAQKVIRYIEKNCNGKMFSICGLSIGAQIVVEVLSRNSDITEYAVVESALVYPIKIASKLSVITYNMCYGLIKKRWYAKLQAKTLNISEELFEDYFKDSSRMTKESLINITKSNSDYGIPLKLSDTKAKVLVLVGEKEIKIMRKSAMLINETISGSQLDIIKNYGHGEVSLLDTKEYLKMLKVLWKDE